ncbi:MAG: class I SAM-dependent methyltransferase [Terriglobales bacterium]
MRRTEEIGECAWGRARGVEGFIGEREIRALVMLAGAAAAAPARGAVMLEIGSFKGKSAVALATVAEGLGLGPLVSVDPHTAPSPTDPGLEGGSSYEAFSEALDRAGVREWVEVHRETSAEAAREWSRPIRLLWIDGDHTWEGARADFEAFAPYLVPDGIVAVHDALHFFEGPIRVFVERMLNDDRFGPAGLFHSIAWAQYRPEDGARWRGEREKLLRSARKVLARVRPPRQNRGINKLRYKWAVGRTPHAIPEGEAWLAAMGVPLACSGAM